MLEGGYHFILDLEGCDSRRLDSRGAMLRVCENAARLMDTRVLRSGSHHFTPHGVTAFVVIAESHISVHTWPESGKAFVDVFTCKEDIDGGRLVEFLVAGLRAKRARLAVLLRKGGSTRLISGSRIPVANLVMDFGHPIYSRQSRLQRIELTRGPMGLSLFLDGYWQFVEKYEHIFHEALVHPALACAPHLHRVGIGGGGDGLALREVVRYPDLDRVVMYELDPAVLRLARTHPEMVRLNRGALDHPKARVVAGDARRMLRPGAGFDVLILDFPSISDGTRFDPLYSASLYRQARSALAPGGILVTQATDWPIHLRRTTANLRRIFRHVLPLEIQLDTSAFNFVIGSDRRLVRRRPLPPGLRFLTGGRVTALLSGRSLVVASTRATSVAA